MESTSIGDVSSQSPILEQITTSQTKNVMSSGTSASAIDILSTSFPNKSTNQITEDLNQTSESTSIIGVVSTQSSNPGNVAATSQTQNLITDQKLITNQSNINHTDEDYYHHDYLYEDYHHELSNISESNTSTDHFNSITQSTTSNNGNIFGN